MPGINEGRQRLVIAMTTAEYVEHVLQCLDENTIPFDPATEEQQKAAMSVCPQASHLWKPSPRQPGSPRRQAMHIKGELPPPPFSGQFADRLASTLLERSAEWGRILEHCREAH